MIVTTDIQDILYKDCKAIGISEIYENGTVPTGEVTTERIVIIAKSQQPGTYWKKDFVEVNLVVPDVNTDNGQQANLIRLQELERIAQPKLDDVCGTYDGTRYTYSIAQIGIEEDTDLKCHFVNVKILFNVLNVK